MANAGPTWYHSNRYVAQSACVHCQGVIRHQPWCIEVNAAVRYAYEILLNPHKMTFGDALILHSLGVVWSNELCEGACKQGEVSY